MSNRIISGTGHQFGRIGQSINGTAKAGASALVKLALIVGACVYVLWNGDPWLLRDKAEQLKNAFFGTYLPPICRTDRSKCDAFGRLKRKPTAVACATNPGLKLHCQLHALFAGFNAELFGGRLPTPIITLRKQPQARGYFWFRRFRDENGERVDEIALDAGMMRRYPVTIVASVLVHEMVHQEQAHFGKPDRTGGHNLEFSQMMRRIGLQTSATGRPGGPITGKNMTHFIIPGGPFDRVARRNELIMRGRLGITE
ncbi:MAG: SprT-like domain-containing protein [Pseudomonadota bacterium]